MRWKFYSALCVLYWVVCVFTSCSDSLNEGNSKDPDLQSGEEAYFSISLSTEQEATTKTYVPDNLIKDWENRVSNVWVLLYDKKNEELQYFFQYKVSNFKNNELTNFHDTDINKPVVAKGEKDEFTSLAQLVKRDSYKMLVLANAEQTFIDLSVDITIGDHLSVVEKALDDSAIQGGLLQSYFGGNKEGSHPFFMSNANGLIEIQPSDLQASKADAEKKPIAVNLDRLLAKVVVKEKSGGSGVPDKVILDSKSVQWYLDVINKKTFLYRKFAHLADGTEENETNSSSKGKEYIYATDPNFNGGDKNEFKRISDGYSPLMTKWVTDFKEPLDTDPTYQYVFENTMSLDAQKENAWSNYTTQIVLEANLIYTDFLIDKNKPFDTSDPGRYYYSYMAGNTPKVFSHEQALFWMERGFPAEMIGLKEKIEANITHWDNSQSEAFNFKALQPDMGVKTIQTYFGITYHPLGLNTYRIPVKHFKPASGISDPQNATYGYFGIVRNNIYTVTINSLNGPGNNVVDPESHYISVDISITPWYRRDFQDEDLGYTD